MAHHALAILIALESHTDVLSAVVTEDRKAEIYTLVTAFILYTLRVGIDVPVMPIVGSPQTVVHTAITYFVLQPPLVTDVVFSAVALLVAMEQ